MTECKKRYENGQYVCNRCMSYWDINDEKPECKTTEEIARIILDKLHRELK